MIKSTVICVVIFVTGISFLPQYGISQSNLEVDGKAKISVLDKDNDADSVVVRLSDGSLGIRDVSTLSALSNSTGNYGTVVNPVTGKVWLDRNLGATQVATSSTDAASYGDLYQWGRGADGHQVRTSLATTTQATDWLSGSGSWDGSFIKTSGSLNWLSSGDTHMWSGTAAENNPCPSGFRIPTNAEWNQERLTWASNNPAGAFASPLELPVAGYRDISDGLLYSVGTSGLYWSSTIKGNVSSTESRYFSLSSHNAVMSSDYRSTGFSIRCIQD